MAERATRDTDDLRLRDMVARLQERRGRTITADATLTAGDDLVLADTTGGNITATLPPAAAHAGQLVMVKKMAAANTLTVAASGSDTIDGGTSTVWTPQYQTLTVVSALVTTPATWGWVIVPSGVVSGGGGGGGSGAPTTATYITQTPDASLSAEQALSLLATGLLKSTTATGVVSIAVPGTDYARSMDELTDADTTARVPVVDDVLLWDGTNWRPVSVVTDGVNVVVDPVTFNIVWS